MSYRFAKNAMVSLLVSITGLLVCLPARAEVIRYFDTSIVVQKDSTIYVTESISYDFDNSKRNGFTRNIPTTIQRSGGTYSVDFRFLGVTEGGDDRPVKARVVKHDDAAIVTIGEPHVPMTGKHVFKIRYALRNGVNYFEGTPELVFNATGGEWPVPIERARVLLYPPAGVMPSQMTRSAYVGDPSGKDKVNIRLQNSFAQFTAAPVNPGQNFVVIADFPKGSIAPPSIFRQMLYWLDDWWPALFVPAFTGAALYVLWWHFGRDAANPEEIVVAWDPPTEMTPAEVGTLYDERCDMQDIIATLIDLAARGHLKIREVAKRNAMGFGNFDYLFIKTEAAGDDAPLRKYEKDFLSAIFGTRDEILLSDLKNSFASRIPAIRDEIYDALAQEGYFLQNPEVVRKQYRTMAVFFSLIGMILILASSGNAVLAPFGIGLFVSAALIGTFAFAMPARTQKGIVALRRSLGFAIFLNDVEGRHVAALVASDPTVFGRLLPYTMVLGAADKWAEDFLGVLHEPPDWFEPNNAASADYKFSPVQFVEDLGAGMRTMELTMVSEPYGASPHF
jgi:hypothetical protein